MNGFSIFMDQDLTPQTVKYIEQMAQAGFEGIFTSLNLPEDDATKYEARLMALGELAQQNELALMVDISGPALKRSGLELEQMKQFGVTGLRADDELELAMIAKLSHEFTIGLNASTITANDIVTLTKVGADFTRLEAWHNYYPRPETGLAKNYFCEQNAFLTAHGLKVNAFIAGNKNLRYPLYQGLPTLEKQRYLDPLVAWVELKNLGVTGVYLGDPGLEANTLERLKTYFDRQVITLRIKPEIPLCVQVLGEHENRRDVAELVIRSANARKQVLTQIVPENTHPRSRGSLTIDNCKYGRYMGEVQLVKQDLPADPKVNILGNVSANDLELMEYIDSGQKFRLVEE